MIFINTSTKNPFANRNSKSPETIKFLRTVEKDGIKFHEYVLSVEIDKKSVSSITGIDIKFNPLGKSRKRSLPETTFGQISRGKTGKAQNKGKRRSVKIYSSAEAQFSNSNFSIGSVSKSTVDPKLSQMAITIDRETNVWEISSLERECDLSDVTIASIPEYAAEVTGGGIDEGSVVEDPGLDIDVDLEDDFLQDFEWDDYWDMRELNWWDDQLEFWENEGHIYQDMRDHMADLQHENELLLDWVLDFDPAEWYFENSNNGPIMPDYEEWNFFGDSWRNYVNPTDTDTSYYFDFLDSSDILNGSVYFDTLVDGNVNSMLEDFSKAYVGQGAHAGVFYNSTETDIENQIVDMNKNLDSAIDAVGQMGAHALNDGPGDIIEMAPSYNYASQYAAQETAWARSAFR
tara:strand:+ start:17334 stop:18542 length:1209 start_codon:yes stop_codon:yes gene_type:complete